MQEAPITDKCFAYLCDKTYLGVAYKGRYYCLQHLKGVLNVKADDS